LIEAAYTQGEKRGLSVWCGDQAGPFQAIPHPGPSWQPQGEPARQPHEYIRNGTAKILTLFHPADGQVRVVGVTSCPNTVLHPWLRQELLDILATLPEYPPTAQASRSDWERWQEGLSVKFTLPAELPPLRLLLVLDNLTGHKTPAFVLWLVAHGVMPLYTPLSGSWLNLAESIQRILTRRALAGQHPRVGSCGWPSIGIRTRHRSCGVASASADVTGSGSVVTAWVVRQDTPESRSPGDGGRVMARGTTSDPLVGRQTSIDG
jgi:hypothetical protein